MILFVQMGRANVTQFLMAHLVQCINQFAGEDSGHNHSYSACRLGYVLGRNSTGWIHCLPRKKSAGQRQSLPCSAPMSSLNPYKQSLRLQQGLSQSNNLSSLCTWSTHSGYVGGCCGCPHHITTISYYCTAPEVPAGVKRYSMGQCLQYSVSYAEKIPSLQECVVAVEQRPVKWI